MTSAAERAKQYRELRILEGRPIVDNRKRTGDRHKNRTAANHKSGKTLTKWERRKIVGWDGEGANTEDGTHIYNLLANSDGTRLVDPNGISTEAALNFFIEYGDPSAINVIYGGSYDVNMILRDVPVDRLRNLWTTGECMFGVYRIFYAPRKKLTIQKFRRGASGKASYRTFTLWDVLGYFQATFVVACKKWLGDLDVLEDIQLMKFDRSEFTPGRLDAIIEYNRMECLLLVQLMEALFAALDGANIKLVRYDGAGSIASALLRANGVPQHKGDPNEEVLKWAQYAYSGGRIEAPKIGNEERPIYRYDINSAYPSSLCNLPSYKGATWTFDKEWDGQDCSMVHIRWCYPMSKKFLKDNPFHPLWYREFDGSILYPNMGEGIYWGVEVRNVVDFMPADSYEIFGACNVHLANDVKPFAFNQDMYHARLVLKKAGNMASEAFKLGMNSEYGKLAQQAGYRNGRIPTYHQLLWAGQTTADTRAKLYRAAMERPRSVIAFATDALITTDPLHLVCGDGLGEWTADKFDGITIVQPGVYWLKDDKEVGNEWHDKYRGFDKGSLVREHIVGCWLMGFDYEARLTRFVGLGSALMSTDFYKHWRTWESNPRTLTLTPSGKRMRSNDTCYWDHLCDTMPMGNVTYSTMWEDGSNMSKPYPLMWIADDDGLKFLREGRELQVLEDELLDSYA